MRRVVVLGTGFAGFHAARRLEETIEGRPHVELTLVGEEASFVYTPLLTQIVSGRLKRSSITFPLANAFAETTTLVREHVSDVDLESRKLLTQERSIPYDYLILAPGSRVDWRSAPECEGRISTFEDADDAASLRADVRTRLDADRADARNDDSTPAGRFCAVVGAGPTGVELAAALATALREPEGRRLSDEPRVTILEKEPQILPGLPTGLRETARSRLEELGVECRTETHVRSALDGGVRVKLSDGEILTASRLLWCGGRRPNKIARRIDTPTDREGRIRVDAKLGVEKTPGVYVAGDAASPPETSSTSSGRVEIAIEQGRRAAENLLADLSGRTTRPWEPAGPRPWFLSLGPGSAAVFEDGSTMTGRAALLLYRLRHSRMIPEALDRGGLLQHWLPQGAE